MEDGCGLGGGGLHANYATRPPQLLLGNVKVVEGCWGAV